MMTTTVLMPTTVLLAVSPSIAPADSRPTMASPVMSWVRAPSNIHRVTVFCGDAIWTKNAPRSMAKPMKCRTSRTL